MHVPPRLILATRNAHKTAEIRAMLGDRFEVLDVTAFPECPHIEETGTTFLENARLKALGISARLDGWVLADDSGLEVDALNGAPGVHSARFAALDTGQPGNSPTAENNAKLLRLLGDMPLDRRTARFRCVLALTPVPRPTGGMKAEECRMQTELFEGTCEGRIDVAPRGRCGFGYDPLFVPAGYDRTFGELDEAIKNKLSHRARALALLRAKLSD